MKRLFSYSLVVLLGLAFVIPATISWSAGTLKVTSPNGGNKWKTGKKYAIKWSKGNAGTHVKIQLLKSNKHYKWVTKKTKNDGKHPWKMPASVATGSAYKIKIVSTKNKKVFDKSNKNFTITKTGDDGGDDDADSLQVTTPNGSESWSTDKKYAIKWDKGNAGKFVKIQLLKSGKHHKWITKKTRNDGKHPWKVPSTVTTGSAYTVKITSRTKKTVTDTSNSTFTITKTGGDGDDSSDDSSEDSDDDDSTVSLSCNASSASESGGKITCTLELSSSTTKTVTIKTSYSGTATAGTDYSGNTTTHTISVGSTSTSWKLTGKSDSKTEGNETIVINITSFTNATEGGKQKETLTLTDVKPDSTITVSSPNGGEKWTTGNKYWIKWDKPGPLSSKVRIELLKSGTTVQVISKKANNAGRKKWKIPSSLETGESYKIKITSTTDNSDTDSSDSNFTITQAGTIPTVSLSCTPDSASEDGGKITCTLSLSNSTSKKVTVEMAYSGTATAGTDYSGANVTRYFKPYRTSSSWTIKGKSDSDASEGDETIVVDISSVTNATEDGTQQASLTLEDAGAPTVSLSCTPDSVSEDGGEITCTLSLSNSTSEKVTVEMAYSGTATAGTDYSGANVTRYFKPYRTSNSWTIKGKSDSDANEGDETIVVDISSVTNATEDGTQQVSLTLTEP
jgi:hypothetical protein